MCVRLCARVCVRVFSQCLCKVWVPQRGAAVTKAVMCVCVCAGSACVQCVGVCIGLWLYACVYLYF